MVETDRTTCACNEQESEMSRVIADIISTAGHSEKLSEPIDVLGNLFVSNSCYSKYTSAGLYRKQMHPIKNEKCSYKNSKIKENESARNRCRRREWNCIR